MDVIKIFKESYNLHLESIDLYPDWLKNEVDNRLIALSLLPKNVYKKLKLQEKENRRAFKIADNIAKKETKIQWTKIPEDIKKNF